MLLTPAVPGVTLSGTATLRVNTTQATQRLVVAGATWTLAAAVPGASYVRVDVAAAMLGLPGFALTADLFVFERQGGDVVVDGRSVGLTLSAGATRILGLSGARLGRAVRARRHDRGRRRGCAAGSRPGPRCDPDRGTVSAVLNTAPSAVTLLVGGTPVTVAAALAGAYARVELAAATLAVAGTLLAADRLVFAQDGTTVSVAGSGLDVLLQAGSTRIIRIEDADAGFRFTSAGVAGATRNGTVTGPDLPGVSVSGTVALAFNTTTTPLAVEVGGATVQLAASGGSPYVRVEITDAALTLLGNAFTADRLEFQVSGGTVALAGLDVGFDLRAGSRRVFSLRHATAALVFSETGVSGSINNAQVLGPDFGAALTISGTVTVAVDTTVAAPFVARRRRLTRTHRPGSGDDRHVPQLAGHRRNRDHRRAAGRRAAHRPQ